MSFPELSGHHCVHDLRRAWHGLARKLHPDRNPSADAEARFKDALQAYRSALKELQGPTKVDTQAHSRPEQVKPAFACARCGDGFCIPGDCHRCGEALLPREVALRTVVATPEVDAMLEALSRRPAPRPPWLAPNLRIPVLAATLVSMGLGHLVYLNAGLGTLLLLMATGGVALDQLERRNPTWLRSA